MIEEYEQVIRDTVSGARRRDLLLQNKDVWNQLTSSLDVIGDTQLAIEAAGSLSFVRKESLRENGLAYLAVYGVLQAFVLQQDAVYHVCEALGVKYDRANYPQLEYIREMRNDSIGHPTKRDRKKGQVTSYHFILRISLSPHGFELLSTDKTAKHKFTHISIPSMIADQEKEITSILKIVIEHLQEEDRKHKERFRMEKLADIFQLTHYLAEKLYEGTRQGDSDLKLGQATAALGTLKVELEKFEEALVRRGSRLETYESIKYLYEVLAYPMAELERFINARLAKEGDVMSNEAAHIYAFFVVKHFEELEQLAKDIDASYEE